MKKAQHERQNEKEGGVGHFRFKFQKENNGAKEGREMEEKNGGRGKDVMESCGMWKADRRGWASRTAIMAKKDFHHRCCVRSEGR